MHLSTSFHIRVMNVQALPHYMHLRVHPTTLTTCNQSTTCCRKLTTFSATHRHNKKSAEDNYNTHSLKHRESLAFYAKLLLIHECNSMIQHFNSLYML